MDGIKEFFQEKKAICIFTLIIFVIFIILTIINTVNKKDFDSPTTTNNILFVERNIVPTENNPNYENIIEVDLKNKTSESYIKYTRYASLDNLEYGKKRKDVNYNRNGTYNLNSIEFLKINNLIKKIYNNKEEYNNLGDIYNGIYENIAIENQKMAENNNINSNNYYTIYYYEVYELIDNTTNMIGTIYKENELKLVEYLFNIEYKNE